MRRVYDWCVPRAALRMRPTLADRMQARAWSYERLERDIGRGLFPALAAMYDRLGALVGKFGLDA